MTNFPKGTDVDTKQLQSVELIHTYFAFYHMNSIRGFTSIITVVCENNIMLWVFINASKCYPICIIRFILTTLSNEKHTSKCVRVEKYGAL